MPFITVAAGGLGGGGAGGGGGGGGRGGGLIAPNPTPGRHSAVSDANVTGGHRRREGHVTTMKRRLFRNALNYIDWLS